MLDIANIKLSDVLLILTFEIPQEKFLVSKPENLCVIEIK